MVCQESVAGRSLVAFSTWHTTFAPLGHPLHPDVAQLEESQLPGSLCSPLKHGVLRGLQGLGHHVQALLLLPALQFLEERGSRSPVSCWRCRWGRRRDRAWRRSPGLPRLGAFCSGQPGLCADMCRGWGLQRAPGLYSGLEFKVSWGWSERGETEDSQTSVFCRT